ncbi:MAG TPA: hypothetical protein VFB43_09155 [Terracidiphilus sp.]|jgi:hypothetical protein|nr:hypothetical protein [Terracidiphilus sp.]
MSSLAAVVAMIWFGELQIERVEDAFALLLMGLVAMAVLVWALAHSTHDESARN